MSLNCPREHCHAPDTACIETHNNLADCPYFKKTLSEKKIEIDAEKGHKFPWNGNSLGLDSISLITAFTKPSLIGLVGQYSSGKTTILATSYLMLSNGFDIGLHSFSGSLTLNGWEQISSYMKFQGFDQPTFPPHTPVGQGRTPGLLHLSLRKNEASLHDVLFTDPPGEWFDKWAENVNDEGAEGARWIATHSTHFVLLIDSKLMSGADSQIAKQELIELAERLGSVSNSRPVAAVWTKADYTVSSQLKEAINNRLNSLFSNLEYFELSVIDQSPEDIIEGFQRLWEWLLETRSTKNSLGDSLRSTNNYFLDYRGSLNDKR